MIKSSFSLINIILILTQVFLNNKSISDVLSYSQSKIAKNKYGDIMTGSNKGKSPLDITFISQYENQKVKQITIHFDKNAIRQINLILSNGIQKMVNHYGEPDSALSKETFIFKEMEYLVGDFIISETNSYVDYISFQTNFNRKFIAGSLSKKQHEDPEKQKFDANNCFLAGFFGYHENVFNKLGIILYKPISKTTLTEFNVVDLKQHSEIKSYKRKTYPSCNLTKKETTYKHNFTKKGGEKHDIQISTIDGVEIPEEFQENLLINARLPTLIVRQGKNIEWYQESNNSIQPSFLDNFSSTHEQVWSEVSTCTCTWVDYSWTEGKLSHVPFIAKIVYTLKDGYKLDQNVTGFFSKSKVVNYSQKLNSKVQSDESSCRSEDG